MKLPNLSLNDLFRSPPSGPVLVGAHAGSDRETSGSTISDRNDGLLLFARGRDDDGFGDGDYDDDPPYEEPAQSTRRAPGAQRGTGGAGGSGGGNGGRQRSVQFQPEERYWTEYLRIALPIVGLLLMIGLFWYWASQLTDDDNGEPIGTETPGVAELITPDSTPAPTQQQVAPPTSAAAGAPASTPEPEAPAEDDPPVDEPVEEEPAAEEPAADPGVFAVGDAAVVTADGDGLNLREEASSDSASIATLSAGDVLEIVSGPEEGGDYQWYEVIVEDETSASGFVAADFIEPPE